MWPHLLDLSSPRSLAPPHFSLFSLLDLDFPPPPLPPHSFYIFFHSQIHRLHIDPTSTLDSFQHSFVNSETMYTDHHISIVFPPPPPPHYCCFPPPPTPPHFHCFPSTTTATTFLLFSLLLLLLLITIWVWHFRPDFGLFGLFEGKQ